MDANKLAKLQEIEYKVLPTCGLCKHSRFNGQSAWGECKNQTYDHLKHTDYRRQLSIHACGTCPNWEPGLKIEALQGFKELLLEGLPAG